MTPRSLVLGSLVALAIAPGCKTTAGALPGWDDPAGDPVAAGDPSADDGEPEAAGSGGEGESGAGPTALAAADAPADPADSGDDPEAAGDEGGAAASAAPVTLPEPVHKKIDKACGKDPGVGERLKAFELGTSDGGKVTQGTYRGRVLVVNFWGTWCKPCLKELPEFDQLYRRYRKHGMTLLAIATDEDAAPVNEFKKKRRLAAKLAIGGEDYAGKYSSSQFPFTFVVDTKGVIKSSFRGYKPECMGKLEDDIRKELDKRAKARAE